MAIYTKRGDKGETGLFSSDPSKKRRVSKSSLRINAIGSLDEANSFLGMVSAFCRDKKLRRLIEEIQTDLLTIGSILAGSKLKIDKRRIKETEKEIDGLEGKLSVLTNFILPGGGEVGSLLHFARTLARRAERAVVALHRKEKVDPEILVYLNRLSDYMFMLARDTNKKGGIRERIWSVRK